MTGGDGVVEGEREKEMEMEMGERGGGEAEERRHCNRTGPTSQLDTQSSVKR